MPQEKGSVRSLGKALELLELLLALLLLGLPGQTLLMLIQPLFMLLLRV